MPNIQHWGSLAPNLESEPISDLTLDIERSMTDTFMHEFEENDDHSPKNLKIEVLPLNSHVMYAILLHKHAKNVADLMKSNEASNNKTLEKIEPKMPALPVEIPSQLNYKKEDFKNFEAGKEPEVVNLSKTIARKISVKCVSTLFAHIGYETSQQSALDLAVDVFEEFFKKISHHLKAAIEDREVKQYHGFPNVIERVLTEIGMGGLKSLEDYYKYRILHYNKVLENRCKELHDDYMSLTIPKLPSPIDKINKVVRVKVEEEEDVVEVENPEVHFSTLDGDVNLSILETGYQLLNSLEAEANLQSLGEGVEDINVNESPGVNEEIAHLSPFNKKKRFK